MDYGQGRIAVSALRPRNYKSSRRYNHKWYVRDHGWGSAAVHGPGEGAVQSGMY
jgi:hypothetical protein